jgi:hypothetical protein
LYSFSVKGAVIQSSSIANTSVRYTCSDSSISDIAISETASSVSSEAKCEIISTSDTGAVLLNEGIAWSEINLLDGSFKSKAVARSVLESRYSGVKPARFTSSSTSTYFSENFTFDSIESGGQLLLDFNVEGTVNGTGLFNYEIGYTTASTPFQRFQNSFENGIFSQKDSYEIDLGASDTFIQLIIKTYAGATANALTGNGGSVDFSNTSWFNVRLSDGRVLTPSDARTLASPRQNIGAVDIPTPATWGLILSVVAGIAIRKFTKH